MHPNAMTRVRFIYFDLLKMKFISPLFGFALLLTAAISSQGAAPTVFIRCPTNGAVFTAAPDLTLIAQAADPDVGGSVSRVDFYRGNTLIGQSTNGGFSLVWSNVAAGVYALTAVATDNTGLSATSAVVNLSINPLVAN